MKEKIAQAANNPRELEALYRGNPAEFTRILPELVSERPDSEVLQAWHERLFFNEQLKHVERSPVSRWCVRDVGLAVFLSLIAGTLAKLPLFFDFLDDERFYSRNIGSIIAGALIVYFCIQRRCRPKTVSTLVATLLGLTLYLNLLPEMSETQTIVLACLHMPFLLWSILGVAFLGGDWRDLRGRLAYLRYNGELLIFSSIIFLGGMVFTPLTLTLFSLINLNIGEWYFKNVIVYGAAALPIIATLLIDRIVGGRLKLAPLLAKVFAPLFFVMVTAYLIAMTASQRSPFTDRDFLITFNALLLIVLGLCIFSISERNSTRAFVWFDVLNIGLVTVTLVIDIVALAAIFFRLASYGFSPNRLAVLGANLLVFCHLAGIAWHYTRFICKRSSFERIEMWIAGYIPAYTIWGVIVTVGFPLLLRLA